MQVGIDLCSELQIKAFKALFLLTPQPLSNPVRMADGNTPAQVNATCKRQPQSSRATDGGSRKIYSYVIILKMPLTKLQVLRIYLKGAI